MSKLRLEFCDLVIDSCTLKNGEIDLTLVPGFFDPKISNPKITVNIVSNDNSEQYQLLKSDLFKKGIDGIEIDGSNLTAWLPDQEKPIVIVGSIRWQKEKYGAPDYLKGYEVCRKELDSFSQENVHLRRTISDTMDFIDKALDRNARIALSRPNDKIDRAQHISMLKSVRRILTDGR